MSEERGRRFGRPSAYMYWGLSFGRLATYMGRWGVPARLYGLVIGRRVFIGVLLGDDPKPSNAAAIKHSPIDPGTYGGRT